MPVSQAVGTTLPLLIFADWLALYFYWREWEIKHIRLLLPMAVVGVFMGTYLLANLPDNVLRQILGMLTLLAVAYKLANDYLASLTYQPRNWHGYLAGWASGLGSAVANVGGPPFTAYMLFQRTSPKTFIGTTTLFFAALNIVKLPIFLRMDIINFETLTGIVWTLPIVIFGVWLGRKIIEKINPKAFEWLMTVLLLGLGLILLFGQTS